MTNAVRRVIVAALCIAASFASLLTAQPGFQYRTYVMGDDLRTIAQQVGVPSPPDPVLPRTLGAVEELKWRAEYVRRGAALSGDSVARLVFSFYEDQLFRIVIDYAPERTEEMTEADLVAAVSKVYGPPTKRPPLPDRVGWHLQRAEDVVIAQWSESVYRVSLLAGPGQSTFRMIVSSSRLEALARAAGTLVGPADPEDRAAIEAGSPRPNGERAAAAKETTRRANIASFIP